MIEEDENRFSILDDCDLIAWTLITVFLLYGYKLFSYQRLKAPFLKIPLFFTAELGKVGKLLRVFVELYTCSVSFVGNVDADNDGDYDCEDDTENDENLRL